MDIITNILESYLKDDSIIVLKGISNEYFKRKVDLYKANENKLAYFMSLVSHEKVISYEEYMILYDFVLSQFSKIYIVDNNIYYNLYPAFNNLKSQDLNKIRLHYSEDDERNKDFELESRLKPYLDIFSNVIMIKNRYYVVYNDYIKDEKVEIINLYSEISEDYVISDYVKDVKTYKIIDDSDYLDLLIDIDENYIDRIQITKNNVGIDINFLVKKLNCIKYQYKDFDYRIVKNKKEHDKVHFNQELYNILSRYWNTNDFRDISIYDIDEVDNGSKIVNSVNQYEIITKLVEQVENCKNNTIFRDMFVTAPTGSGKSAIFQIPAIYLAEKYNLFTIVISPLIGLMQDQVLGLSGKGYKYSRTINSDISPIKKQEIIDDISENQCHILYLSPESLMSKSDLIQLIGNRKLGLIVIDEAHIVTTWGKQFRPDYWYLGDHITKLRKSQLKREGMQFVIATFTATAIYGGIENMYQETIQSLNMIDPITYLGYIKRNDIQIKFEKDELINNRTEYELDKFEKLVKQIDLALMRDKKVLIYFPTVALIDRFYEFCKIKDYGKYVTKYHGKLNAFEKNENYLSYKNKEKYIMLATKAFGMGIDIDDIELVLHFAPTGNVCDYLQEIGRAARKTDLIGEAYYNFMSNDFKHINRLHGLSTIKIYQLVKVIEKVYYLYLDNIKNNYKNSMTRKRNEMLIDAECFSHIFENPFFSEDDGINKVKTAMLLIQKDFEKTLSFSPFTVKPIPLFEIGFFKMDNSIADELNNVYGNCTALINKDQNIYNVNLKIIWEKDFCANYSFPKFKYMLYTGDAKLGFNYINEFIPALVVTITYVDNHMKNFNLINSALKEIITLKISDGTFTSQDELEKLLMSKAGVNKYQAKNIIEVTISAIKIYGRDFSKTFNSNFIKIKPLKNGDIKYSFSNSVFAYFKWLEKGLEFINNNLYSGDLFLCQDKNKATFKEYMMILGVLESYNIMVFKALGGRNSQLYIYVNQTKTLKEIISRPYIYKNSLVEMIKKRHEISVAMLSYLFENNFNNDEIWDHIENYFLGQIPDDLNYS